ncbi:MAG: 2,3-bisphosphoglycerate-independent phosphoglycerate mutase [Gemmatimonadetes bacterium]|nr:2,3-bisphosphoglycerate-independent phosphoglycerate mutase [Gemmatimonadota bacterium]
MSRRPVFLVILDGWGLREETEGNAVMLAETPVFDRLQRTCPSTRLAASGLAVGLPEGQMGNSEVGHLTIGAGRIPVQDITRIDGAIASGEFYSNPVLVDAMGAARRPAALHLVGLLSNGGVHSHHNHCYALLELARRLGLEDVFVHGFTDGRDTSPTSGAEEVRGLLRRIDSIGVGVLATLVGRYWAMDRDKRWERTRVAYDALTLRRGERSADPAAALEASYAAGVTDEFVQPLICAEGGGVRAGDAVVFFNFRADRGRQLAWALVDPAFDCFPRDPSGAHLIGRMVTMTGYDEGLRAAVAFPSADLLDGLGEIAARAGLRQLRAAETEKYAHVTYFFNGGMEQERAGEDRLLVPSPRVATYDLEPEMSARELTDRAIAAMRAGGHDLLILNYANPDMVGHTGDLEAAIRAVETVDRELGRLLEGVGGTGLVIADHGNAETMREPDGTPHTAHTTNPVPCILIGAESGVALRAEGGLQDVAPTLLGLLGIPQPESMRGRDLIAALRADGAGGVPAPSDRPLDGASARETAVRGEP